MNAALQVRTQVCSALGMLRAGKTSVDEIQKKTRQQQDGVYHPCGVKN